MDVSKARVGLFFTEGISLRTWEKSGFMEHERAWYGPLAERTAGVSFFTYGDSDEAYAGSFGGRIRIVPRISHMPSFLYSFLLPFIRRKEVRACDVFKTNQMRGAWAAMLAKGMYGKKLVVRCGYEWLRFMEFRKKYSILIRIAEYIERLTYRAADAIILTSHADRKFVAERFGISEERIRVIPNYVDTDLFSDGSGTEKESGKILYFGRLDAQKNLHALIDACAGLPVRLVCIGNGPEKERLVAHALAAGVPLAVKDRMDQRDLVQEIHSAELFVLPSLFEGSPKTLLEALSCGAACVATDIEAVREIVPDDQRGIIAELCGAEAASIRDAVRMLMDDPEKRQRLGKNARMHILEYYSRQRLLSEELSIYEHL